MGLFRTRGAIDLEASALGGPSSVTLLNDAGCEMRGDSIADFGLPISAPGYGWRQILTARGVIKNPAFALWLRRAKQEL